MTDELGTTQRYIVCDALSGAGTDQKGLCRSPLICLERAIENVPDMILIRFPEPVDPIHEIYVELCEVLKRNRRTRRCTVTALIPRKDRFLIDRLHSAGVDYAATPPCGEMDDGKMLAFLNSLDERHRVHYWRETLCPYLSSVALDESRTMIVCGAYQNRMVLGGRRLHELCETENHIGCEYFQTPRIGS